MNSKIFPSLMAKNQKELDILIKKFEGVTKELHIDIVDGKFAKNKTFQFPFKLNPNFQYNVHLMIKNPEKWIKNNRNIFSLIIPHFEEIKNKTKYIQELRQKKKKVALAILPETTVSKLSPYLKKIDYLLILTVHPGFYGSKFLKSELNKIRLIKKINHKIKIMVDGGMNPKTIKMAHQKGGDLFISGSYLLQAKNPKKKIQELLHNLK